MLLSRDLKRNSGELAAVASLVVAGYLLNMYWTIVPAFPRGGFIAHVVNACAVVAFGGLWLALCCWRLGRLRGRQVRARQVASGGFQDG
jgi:hypothetical protein